MSDPSRVVVVGGGAAGFFAAITCASAARNREVVLLEQGPQFLTKVRISGGGRCNVTNACQNPRELSTKYPRGGRALIGPLTRFGPRETVEWFARRGVRLHAEADGRMFPVTNSSATIVDCLRNAAREAGVALRTGAGVRSAESRPDGFDLTLSDGSHLECARLCVAIGGCRSAALGKWIEALGHTIETPVPSLFAFHVNADWLRDLAGIAMPDVAVSVPETKLRERGPVLLTHWGLSGPAILRLSAWGARELHGMDYHFPLRMNWLPDWTADRLLAEFQSRRGTDPNKAVVNHPIAPVPARLWAEFARGAGIGPDVRWTTLTRASALALADALTRMELPVHGKTLNKDEFVTCGGVRLKEVDFKTMESRLCPGLHFAGEVLDIDGITGGFNFQAAWTTGWIAGHAMAGVSG